MEYSRVKLSLWQRARLSHAWRVPATGFGFVLFGLGAIVLSLSVFPLLYLLPISQQRKARSTRLVISNVFRTYIYALRFLGLLSFEFHNVDQLRQPNQLILANHPSLLDVVFIIALTGDTSCVVKSSLWKNPITIAAMHASNYISNQDKNLFQRCLNTLKEGNSLIIFPEGTRTQPGQPLKFHRGPSNIALSLGQPIKPVVISCQPAALLKNQKWYRISPTPPHFTIRAMPNIEVVHYLDNEQLQSTAARQLTRDLVTYFTEQTAT